MRLLANSELELSSYTDLAEFLVAAARSRCGQRINEPNRTNEKFASELIGTNCRCSPCSKCGERSVLLSLLTAAQCARAADFNGCFSQTALTINPFWHSSQTFICSVSSHTSSSSFNSSICFHSFRLHPRRTEHIRRICKNRRLIEMKQLGIWNVFIRYNKISMCFQPKHSTDLSIPASPKQNNKESNTNPTIV